MIGQGRVGISGWRYEPWRGTFYPRKLPQRQELEYASRQVNSIEINGSFYSLQRPENYRLWHEQTPEDFVFSVKGSRYITHMLRLKDCRTALANFFASGILKLKEKLGPLLWQLPPNFKFDQDVIANFLALLPKDFSAASRLARRHDAKVRGRAYIGAGGSQPLRHAMEVRHESFKRPEFIDLLRKYRVALVVADTAGKWPLMEDLTADFVYVRLHGDEEIYVSGYTDEAIQMWAKRVDAWRRGTQPPDAKCVSRKPPSRRSSRDVFVYFDNDVKVRAPADAISLMGKLKALAKSSRTAKRTE